MQETSFTRTYTSNHKRVNVRVHHIQFVFHGDASTLFIANNYRHVRIGLWIWCIDNGIPVMVNFYHGSVVDISCSRRCPRWIAREDIGLLYYIQWNTLIAIRICINSMNKRCLAEQSITLCVRRWVLGIIHDNKVDTAVCTIFE